MQKLRHPEEVDAELTGDVRPSSGRARPGYAPGDLIGQKYRLVRRLGEGGMAEVWVASNDVLEVDVAIKFVRGDLQHPQLDDRLLQEARAAARLGHPAIVRVLDYGKTRRGDPYFVMELLHGEDLATALGSSITPKIAIRSRNA